MTSHRDNYAALTELFTTPNDTDSAAGASPVPAIIVPPSPRIECLVPGHLPVRAGVWFLPCARRLAGPGNAGVLFQLEGEQAYVTGFATEQASGDRTAQLDGYARLVRRWFVLPSFESDPGDYASLGVDRITVLTGTDQAAVVAAYQTIKSIVAGYEADVEQLDIGLFIAGSSVSAAEETAERLATTTRRQLGCQLQLRDSMHQLETIDGTLHRSEFTLAGGAHGLVSDIHRAMATIATAPAAPGADCLPPPPIAPPLTVEVNPDPVPETVVDQPSPAGSSAGQAQNRQAEEGIGRESLARHVAGLAELPVTCPHHPNVDLAVDVHGALNILVDSSDLPVLLAVEAWSAAHAPLLEMACPGAGICPDQPPVLHLFTDDATRVRDLIGTRINLHLLITMGSGANQTCLATPLS